MKGHLHNFIMAAPETFEELGKRKGFKLAHLNVRSLVKKFDQVRLLLLDSAIDVFTISETWLKQNLADGLFGLDGYKMYRQDRSVGRDKTKIKRGGGLITYVKNIHASDCENLSDLGVSNEHIEAQWVYIHRPNCKNTVVCNIYRPPNGDVDKAISYLEESLRT